MPAGQLDGHPWPREHLCCVGSLVALSKGLWSPHAPRRQTVRINRCSCLLPAHMGTSKAVMKLAFNEVLKSPCPTSSKDPIRGRTTFSQLWAPNPQAGRRAGVLAGHWRVTQETGPSLQAGQGHAACVAEAQASPALCSRSQMCFCSGGWVAARGSPDPP